MSATYSSRHPHEPDIPPALDGEGRCLVCRLMIEREDADKEATLWKTRLVALEAVAREVVEAHRGIIDATDDGRAGKAVERLRAALDGGEA